MGYLELLVYLESGYLRRDLWMRYVVVCLVSGLTLWVKCVWDVVCVAFFDLGRHAQRVGVSPLPRLCAPLILSWGGVGRPSAAFPSVSLNFVFHVPRELS